jgi:predicted RNA-binding Zn-ribbon protein involved in translation (DUF1610 family)
MEIVLFLSGLLFGGLISWRITHVYYKKASQDQNTVFNKLSKEVRSAILEDNREKLSVFELNELIREKTIDRDVGEAIPYMACPRCGSEDLERTSDVEVDYGPEGTELAGHYDIVRCKECGWEKTSHGYESPRDNI